MAAGALARTVVLGAALAVLVACDPGAEVGFAPVEPLPTPDVDAAPGLWWPAEGEAVTPETRVLDVLVLEQECAGGESAEGRIREPLIEADESRVVVTVLVEVLRDPVTCPDNPPTPAVLDLGEPLGERELVDGGADPPRAPAPPD